MMRRLSAHAGDVAPADRRPDEETAAMRAAPAPPALGEPPPPVGGGDVPPPRRRPPLPPERELWPWLVALLVVALAGLGVGLWLAQRGGEHSSGARTTTAPASTVLVTRGTKTGARAPGVVTVAVPKVVGLGRAAAVSELRSFGFKPELRRQASSRPPGTVVGQKPRAGSKLARGAAVILAVSPARAPARTRAATTAAAPAVSVPDVRGLAAPAAARRLHTAGLEVEERSVASAKPAGTVLSEAPTAGRNVTRGTKVVLTTSLGPATNGATAGLSTTVRAPRTATTVPSLVGEQRADAQRALRRAGLVTAVKGVPSTKPEGVVVSQSPKAGAGAKRGDHVLINVASGRKPGEGTGPPTTVPDVVGEPREQARRELRAAGLVTEVEEYPSTKPAGTVLAQSPKAGSSERKGSHALINVSNGTRP